MKKHLTLITTATLLSLALAVFSNEGMIYLAATIMAAAAIIALRKSGKRMMRVTRWARSNPRKTQILITVVLLFMLSLGLVVGYDLMQLGYKFSDATAVFFSLVMVIGFFSVPMFQKKDGITLPFVLNRHRIIYTAILVASYALAVVTGNRVEDKFPGSIVANVLRSIDQRLFLQDNTADDEQFSLTVAGAPVIRTEAAVFIAFASTEVNESPSSEPTLSKKEAKARLKEVKKAKKLEKKQKRMVKKIEKWRKAFAAGGSGATVLLIILLVLGACTGVCLIIGGFSGGSAWAVVLGVAVLTACIYGIVKVSKKRREQREKILKEEAKP